MQWKYFQVQWKLEQEGRKWVHSSFLETNNFGFWSRYQDILQGDFFEDYFLLAYKSLTWMLWSKTKCGKVDSLATMIFQFLRFHGLWKPTTTWSTISGNLELLLKLWNSRGDDNQVGFDHQSPLRNTITCSTKTERVIRTKSGGRIDKWASFPLKHSEWKYFLPGDSFRWVARRVLSHKLLGRCLHHEPVCQE